MEEQLPTIGNVSSEYLTPRVREEECRRYHRRLVRHVIVVGSVRTGQLESKQQLAYGHRNRAVIFYIYNLAHKDGLPDGAKVLCSNDSWLRDNRPLVTGCHDPVVGDKAAIGRDSVLPGLT